MYATNAASHTQILPVIKDTWFYTLVEGISLQMCRNFYSKYDLSDHLLTHDDVKHFSCKHCDKTFQTRGGLNSHKRIHNADYKYVCDHCGKGFIYKVILKDIKQDMKTLYLLFVTFVADNLDIRAVLLDMCVVLQKT